MKQNLLAFYDRVLQNLTRLKEHLQIFVKCDRKIRANFS